MAREKLIFKDSAFRHGFSDADYDEVLRNPKLVLRSRRGHRNVYEILGTNDAGEYLHVITRRYRDRDQRIVIVFHIARMSQSDRKRFQKVTKR